MSRLEALLFMQMAGHTTGSYWIFSCRNVIFFDICPVSGVCWLWKHWCMYIQHLRSDTTLDSIGQGACHRSECLIDVANYLLKDNASSTTLLDGVFCLVTLHSRAVVMVAMLHASLKTTSSSSVLFSRSSAAPS